MAFRPAPVVIFGYRRADHLEKVLRALAAEDLAKTTLCILCLDGSKTPGEQRQIDRVRDVARADWGFGEIQIRAAKANQGLVRSITSGVTDVCREHGQAIVLEDDIVPRKGFLDFMNEALEKYRDTPRVMQVSGYAYPVSAESPRHSFLPLTSCWGWATWQRAWQQYGWNPDLGRADLSNPDFLRRFDLQGAYPYSRLLRDVLEGKSDSWGVIWYWNVFRSGGLSLFPAQSLVDNIGWDGTGEHAAPSWRIGSKDLSFGIDVPWPKTMHEDLEIFAKVGAMLAGKAGVSSVSSQRGGQ